MNKIKAFFWIVLAGFILIVFFSNLELFLRPMDISLNLIIKNYSLPALPAAVFFLIFFAAGLLVAYFSNLPERFRHRKTIKNLKATIDSQDKEIERIRTIPKPEAANSTPENP
jgi:uncharacterized integral membrane protein